MLYLTFLHIYNISINITQIVQKIESVFIEILTESKDPVVILKIVRALRNARLHGTTQNHRQCYYWCSSTSFSCHESRLCLHQCTSATTSYV